MGLIASLAVTRVHALVVEAPGRPMLRLRAEAAVRARGWLVAESPSDADLLLVCGERAGRFAAIIAELWARMPEPRVQRTIQTAEEVAAALDDTERALATAAHDAAVPPAASDTPGSEPQAARPRVELGPGAPWWPAGLVVTGEERDGLLVAVRVRVLAAAQADPDPADPTSRGMAIACAEASRFLRVAGWPLPAARFDRIVDRVLAGGQPSRQRRRIRTVAAMTRRSATFDAVLARAAPGVPLRARLRVLLAAAERAIHAPVAPTPIDATRLAARLEGARSSAVPLLVAAGWDGDG